MKFKEMPYTRADYGKEKERFDEILAGIRGADSAGAQLNQIREYYRFADHISTMMNIASIRHTIDTNDKFYTGEVTYYDETGPQFEDMKTEFYRTILGSPCRAGLEQALGAVYFKNAEIAVRAFDKAVIADMAEENRLVTEYSDLTASAQVDFDGEKLTLAQLGRYRQSPDRSVRKKANEIYFGFFDRNAEQYDDLYDRLVKVRDSQAKKMGFENYVELGYLRMGRNCYGQKDVAAFRSLVREKIVPLAVEIREKQRGLLGVDKILYYDDDTVFKEGNPAPIGTPEEIFKNGLKMYRELSEETGAFFDFMLENDLFDALAKKGKASGGYCTELPDYRCPFIFSNFNGTFGDIDVLTHEAGHAFQFYLSRDNYPSETRFGTMESAEIDSMSMEFFAWPWMELFFGDKADRYRYMHLGSALKFIPYGTAVDEFQHVVYENPHFSPKERNSAWREIERQYQPDLDYGGYRYLEEGGRWQRQAHIYANPFYYIDYCLAQTCALNFWALMRKDHGAAWESYIKLCKLGGKDTFTGLLAQIGMQSPFSEGCLETVAKTAQDYLDHFDQSKLI
jgi:oligoendopeptidase, M3 family